MKKLLILPLLLLVFAVNLTKSQDDMQKWMDYMTPGDMQKMLANGVGTWNVKTEFWMAPGGESTKSEGTSVGEMIMGGRYLMSKFSGNMMGMPFEGMSIEAYDNAAKMFMSTWIDNFGTGIMYMTGTYDATTKQLTYTGNMVDPMSGKMVAVREVITYSSATSTKMEMFGPDQNGNEYKTMEINYTK